MLSINCIYLMLLLIAMFLDSHWFTKLSQTMLGWNLLWFAYDLVGNSSEVIVKKSKSLLNISMSSLILVWRRNLSLSVYGLLCMNERKKYLSIWLLFAEYPLFHRLVITITGRSLLLIMHRQNIFIWHLFVYVLFTYMLRKVEIKRTEKCIGFNSIKYIRTNYKCGATKNQFKYK